MSADILEYVDQKVRDSASSSTEWSILYADDWAKLRAEIVRLRREVCSCPSGDGSLRWPCKAHPPESIAPAEAKGDAPGKNVHTEHCCREHGCKYGDAECPVEHGRQVQSYPCEDCTPQPADGGAVAWLISEGSWKRCVLTEEMAAAIIEGADMAGCRQLTKHPLYTTPPAPVQAAPPAAQVQPDDHERQWREGWAFSYSGRKLYGDDGELQDNSEHPFIDWRRDAPALIREKVAERSKRKAAQAQQGAVVMANMGDSEAQFIADAERLNCPACGGSGHVDDTHPAGDALGAVRPLVDRWRGWIGQYDTGDEAIRDCIDELEAALQHRGDSQEVGRG